MMHYYIDSQGHLYESLEELEYTEIDEQEYQVKLQELFSRADKYKFEKEKKINELKTKLAETDYLTIKYAEGLLSDKEFAKIKEQRQAWRKEINNLQ